MDKQKTNGITLVALVVTVIILLILADLHIYKKYTTINENHVQF